MSSRNLYPGCILFPKEPYGDCVPPHLDNAYMSDVLGSTTDSGKLDKRERPKRDQPPPTKKMKSSTSSFSVGDLAYTVTGWIRTTSLAVWFKK